jgi:DNA-binding NarL/FixJ family response regulator
MIRVQIFDDNESRRDSLEMLICSADGMELAGSSPNCLNAVEDVDKANPDVILMDIEMPGIDGIQATGVIKKKFPDKHIIIQTVFDDSKRVFDAIKAGATGYILKSTPAVKILESIQDANEGGSPMTPAIAGKVLEYFRDVEKVRENEAHENYMLSKRELEVLSNLVNGKSYKMVANELGIAYHTVNSHVKKIYEKLHVHSVAEAVNKAIRDKLVN